MALHEILSQNYFTASSSDIANNAIVGLDNPYAVGLRVYITDTKMWKIVNDDYTLSDYIINSDLQVADIQIGAVELKDATTDTRATVGANGLYTDIRNIQAGSNKIGSVNIRNNANDANIDPLSESTFTGRIGEVQANPTANTLLGRVKDLLTGIVLSAGTAIIGKVGIDQTSDGTTNLVVVKQSTHDNLNLNANMQVGNNDVTPLNQVNTNVSEFELSKEITLAAGATIYSINDIINADSATTLPELDFGTVIGSAAARKIQINSIQITSSNGAASTRLLPEVILYNANALTGQTLTDNTAFNPSYAQHVLKKATAFSRYENWVTGDFAYGNFYETRLTEVIRNATLDALGKLYLALIATNAYTPAASEKFTITIKFYLLN